MEHQHTYRTAPATDAYRENWEKIFRHPTTDDALQAQGERVWRALNKEANGISERIAAEVLNWHFAK
mgnify:CR=1 FL=1